MARPMNSDGERGLTQQDILNLARSLRQSGMKQEDVAELFGAGFGVPSGTPNYDQLFAQYMPTFVQLNQSEPENSIRRSIARDVMDNTPIWEIEQGIANAIERGDVGITPGTKLSDLVSFARTLESEYRNYTNAASKQENQTVFQRMGFPDPSERYTVEQMFPEVLDKLVQLQQQYPEYLTGAVGSGAKLPARVSTSSAVEREPDRAVVRSEIDVEKENLKNLKSLLSSKSVISSGYGMVDGKRMSLQELIDARETSEGRIDELRKQEALAAQAGFAARAANKEQEKERRKQSNFAIYRFREAEEVLNRAIRDGGVTKIRDESGVREISLDEAQERFASAFSDLESISPDSPYIKNYKGTKPKMSGPAETLTGGGKPGPGGYIGPARGESTMARDYDPYWRNTATQVLAGLQQKIDKSGRTPFMDAATNFMAFSKYINRK